MLLRPLHGTLHLLPYVRLGLSSIKGKLRFVAITMPLDGSERAKDFRCLKSKAKSEC